MVTDRFPLGTSALHPDWPQARFNVSGMFVHHPLVIGFVNLVQGNFDCPSPVEAIHGAPSVPWNAGRFSKVPFNPNQFKSVLETLNSKGVGYFPTFTNHLVTNDDLANPTCNFILDCIAERPDLNGVILTSDLLSSYIAKKHPALRQVASIIKVTFEKGRGRTDYYRELGQRFHRYVIHPDDCRDLKLIEQLDRDKAEFIVNENCVVDCPQRARHYDAYARLQRAAGTPDQPRYQQEIDQIVARCRSPLRLENVKNQLRSCNLIRSEIKAIYDLGFRHFKLQGRADDPYSYAYDLIRFMLDPDLAAPHAHKLVTQWLGRVLTRPN